MNSRLNVNVRCQQEIGNMSLALKFDPRLMNMKDVIEGGMMRQLGDKVPFLKNINNSAGICTIGFSSPPTGKGIKGGGSLVTLLFESKSSGEGLISITSCSAGSPSGQTISFQTQASRIIIR